MQKFRFIRKEALKILTVNGDVLPDVVSRDETGLRQERQTYKVLDIVVHVPADPDLIGLAGPRTTTTTDL